MAGTTPDRTVLLLGGTGKLARMMQHAACAPSFAGLDLVPVARRGAGLCWSPGAPADRLPRAAVILALWGVTGGDALADNAPLADAAADLARRVGARRVLHASSAAVYGPAPRPACEDAALAPAGGYGASKLAMEHRIAALADRPGAPEHVILRIANVLGADQLSAALGRGGPVVLDRFADGTGPVRSYIAPQDLAAVLAAAIRAPRLCGTLNVAAPRPVAMAALARAAGADTRWRAAPPEAVQTVALDTARLAGLCPLGDAASDARRMVAQARAVGALP